jgi:hypothetical protein
MVAPAYAETRRELVNQIGLGKEAQAGGRRRAGAAGARPAPKVPSAKARRGRRPKSS